MLPISHAPTVHPLPSGIHYLRASTTRGHPPPVGNTGNQAQALREKHWLRGTDTMRTKKEKVRMKKIEKEFLPAPLDHQTRVRGTHPNGRSGCEERTPQEAFKIIFTH